MVCRQVRRDTVRHQLTINRCQSKTIFNFECGKGRRKFVENRPIIGSKVKIISVAPKRLVLVMNILNALPDLFFLSAVSSTTLKNSAFEFFNRFAKHDVFFTVVVRWRTVVARLAEGERVTFGRYLCVSSPIDNLRNATNCCYGSSWRCHRPPAPGLSELWRPPAFP